jgi:hypothetical protein
MDLIGSRIRDLPACCIVTNAKTLMVLVLICCKLGNVLLLQKTLLHKIKILLIFFFGGERLHIKFEMFIVIAYVYIVWRAPV